MKREKKSLSYDEQNLLGEIQLAQNAMDSAFSNFQQVTEPDLIDCYIYMMNAATKRYKFLIERARSMNLKGYNEPVMTHYEDRL